MRVIATKFGFDGVARRRPGDEFDMPDGSSGSWFVPVAPSPAPEVPAPAAKASKRKRGESADDLA